MLQLCIIFQEYFEKIVKSWSMYVVLFVKSLQTLSEIAKDSSILQNSFEN
jgi:hypothetical protein